MRISDWSSDVCSSDLTAVERLTKAAAGGHSEGVLVGLTTLREAAADLTALGDSGEAGAIIEPVTGIEAVLGLLVAVGLIEATAVADIGRILQLRIATDHVEDIDRGVVEIGRASGRERGG